MRIQTVVSLALLSLCACSGRTPGMLTVTPTYACPGSPVQVEWSSGFSDAEVRTPDGMVFRTGTYGRTSFTATTGGRVTLTANGYTAYRDLFVVSSPQSFGMVVGMTCGRLTSGLIGVTGTQPLQGSYDSRLQVDSVRVARRVAEVIHEGRSSLIFDGVAAPASGALTGNYTVTSLLDVPETCDIPDAYSAAAPRGLGLEVWASCR